MSDQDCKTAEAVIGARGNPSDPMLKHGAIPGRKRSPRAQR
jgi:hypothetical protein